MPEIDADLKPPLGFNPKFKPVDSSRYDEMLGMLPPIYGRNPIPGFMVGEASSHRRCAITAALRPTYAAFFEITQHKLFESIEPLTVPEYNAVTRADLVGAETATT